MGSKVRSSSRSKRSPGTAGRRGDSKCGPGTLVCVGEKAGERDHGQLRAKAPDVLHPVEPGAWEGEHTGGAEGGVHSYHVLKAVPVLQLVPKKAGDCALVTLGQGPHLQTLVPQGHAKEDPKICGPCTTGTCEYPALPVQSCARLPSLFPVTGGTGAQSPEEAFPPPEMFPLGPRLRQQGQASMSSLAGTPLPLTSRAPHLPHPEVGVQSPPHSCPLGNHPLHHLGLMCPQSLRPHFHLGIQEMWTF